MKKTKLAICQMSVVPGRPDLNAAYMVAKIKEAALRGMDVIVFPEMCISGYLIGDRYEDDAFVLDVVAQHETIRKATEAGITAIFGSLFVSPAEKGEDGRMLKSNAGFVFTNGETRLIAVKTLQPNYRIFDDDRHFLSAHKISERTEKNLAKTLSVATIPAKNGDKKIGVILCEDMWHADYYHNPTKALVDAGAEMIFNLSCSPWGWQKNRKRHQVVADLLAECPVPFIYVNNTGMQNNGKNIIVFDGASTVYRPDGEIVFEVEPYADGVFDLAYADDLPPAKREPRDDTTELYEAVKCSIWEFFGTLPEKMRKAVIGLSGGIDSALVSALLVDTLGSENVFAINMPSQYNSEATMDMAKTIADNLGIHYEVIPIQGMINAIAGGTGCAPDTLAYENIQARIRREVLATKASLLRAVFVGNANKVETAFGYGTLNGDIAGFMMPIGGLVKREVYQLAEHMNRVFGRVVIPQECFEIAPSAELARNQEDPFDYGNIKRRGYHDEMVRALVDFRKNPEWFLEKYLEGTLEDELGLEAGRLQQLFPTAKDFVADLERCWGLFCGAVFKRVQAPPISLVSKRDFGYDLREAMLPAHHTARHYRLKAEILAD